MTQNHSTVSVDIECYGVDGNREEDADKSLAKKITSKTSGLYYLKKNTAGRIFNPYSQEPITKADSVLGRCKYRFVVVSREAFDNYLAFLSTKKDVFLRRAERE